MVKKAIWQKGKAIKWEIEQFESLKMVSWQNDNLTNEKLTKWQTELIKSWQYGSLIKCQFDKMAHWHNKN